MAMKSGYFEKRKRIDRETKKRGEGRNRPRAYWQEIPHFTAAKKKSLIYIGEFGRCPVTVEDPVWNESDESGFHYRIHYLQNGIIGINGRKSCYVFCSRTIDSSRRCGLCEPYRAAYKVHITPLMDELGNDHPDIEAEKSIVRPFRCSEKFAFPVLNIGLIEDKAPKCFTIEGQLDIQDKKCQACLWQDACFRGGIGVEIFNMTKSCRSKFDEALDEVYSNDNKDYDGSFADPKNAVLWNVTYKRKEYNIDPAETSVELSDEIIKIWESTFPKNLEVLFQETHTYAQMLAAVPKSTRLHLEEWFDQEGLDYPEDIDSVSSEDEDEIEQKKEKPSRQKRRDISKTKTTRSRKRAVVTSSSSDQNEGGLLDCFSDSDVYDPRNKKCYKCSLFEQCGEVIDDEIELVDALKLLVDDRIIGFDDAVKFAEEKELDFGENKKREDVTKVKSKLGSRIKKIRSK